MQSIVIKKRGSFNNTEIYLQIKMGQKNGKPVLTEEQAEALGASSGMDASQVGFFYQL